MLTEKRDEAHEDMRLRLEETLDGRGTLDTRDTFRAIIGGSGEELAQTAAFAREKLRAGQSLSQTEWDALELMIRLTRPSVLVRKGIPEGLPESRSEKLFARWEAFREAVRPSVRSVGLIHRAEAPAAPGRGVGTGFLIGPDLLLTNRHVARLLGSEGAVMGVVRFLWEDDSYEKEPVITIRRIAGESEELDVAALQLSSASTGAPLRLDAAAGTAKTVAVIGHPFPDEERNAYFVRVVFGSKLVVKRASPGRRVLPFGGGASAIRFDHDCATLGGNSGSPVFDIETGQVVGLHREGSFLQRN
jgi:S1-C subfamily serine protease